MSDNATSTATIARGLALAAAALLSAAATAANAADAASLPAPVAQPGPLVQTEAPTFVVGEQWTFSYTNDLEPSKNSTYKQTVSAVSPSRVELNGGASALDGNANLVKIGSASYEPSDGKLRFPLRVGDSWSSSYVYRAGSWEAIGERRTKVVAVERVETPAGSFDAFRIEQTVGWSAGGGNRGEGNTRETDWFAPAVGRIIRSDFVDQATHAAPTTTHVLLVGFKPMSPSAPRGASQ